MTGPLPRLHCAAPLTSRTPLVSVCIPTFNRGHYIEDAVSSAIAQTYERLEIIVVDDASDDDTVTLVTAYDDPRIRLHRNSRRLGQNANRNRTLALAEGELIKFLDSDDLLDPDCVAKMVDVFAEDPGVGLVFARRRIAFEKPATASVEAWLARFDELHAGFPAIEPVNDGRVLLAQWLAAGLHDNWIGEPSAVMARRSHMELSGGFSMYVHRTIDADLWARLLPRCLVGFIDEVLVTYRRGYNSEDLVNRRARRGWIDRLWTFESLAAAAEVRQAFPELERLRSIERRQAWRTAVRLGRVSDAHSVALAPYLRYLWFRALSRIGRDPDIFAQLPEHT